MSSVTLYGTQTTPGDTAVLVDSQGRIVTTVTVTTVNQGTPAAAANAWPMLVTDGAGGHTMPTGDAIARAIYAITRPDVAAVVTGTITTSSGIVSVATPGYSSVLASVNGTHAGITLNFEASDDNGTTWTSVQGALSSSGAGVTSVAPGTNATAAWVLPGAPWTNVRVRSSAYSSGTMNVRLAPIANPLVLPLLSPFGYTNISVNPATSQAGMVVPYFPTGNGNATLGSPFVRSTFPDGQTEASGNIYGLEGWAHGLVFNGASWDRQYSNPAAVTLLASAARTALAQSPTQVNYNHRGVMLVLTCSAKAAATTLTISLYEATSAGLAYAAGPAVTILAAHAAFLTFYPGAVSADFTAGASVDSAVSKSVVLPRSWFVIVSPGDANSVTYALAAYPLV